MNKEKKYFEINECENYHENKNVFNMLEELSKKTGKTIEQIASIIMKNVGQNYDLLKELQRLLSKNNFVIVQNRINENIVLSFKIMKNLESKNYLVIHYIKNKRRNKITNYIIKINDLEELFEIGLNSSYKIECSGCEKNRYLNVEAILKNDFFNRFL